jgi:hypothetical protein
VGYGDIVPQTTLGKIAVCVEISLGLVTLGVLSSRLIDTIKDERRAGMGSAPRNSKSLLLITGDADTETLHNVLSELFHAEHTVARRYIHVVILLDSSFSVAGRRWLAEQPVLSSSVTYLRGSVLRPRDMERAGVLRPEMEACFILQSHSVNADDKANIMRAIALRIAAPKLPIFCNISRAANKHHVIAAGVPDHMIICHDVIRGGLLAANVLTPGAIAIITNLFSAEALPVENVKTADFRTHRSSHAISICSPPPALDAVRAALPSTSAQPFQVLQERVRSQHAAAMDSEPAPPDWKNAYLMSSGQEVLEILCPAWLVGSGLMKAAILVYCSGILLNEALLNGPAAQDLEAVIVALAEKLSGAQSNAPSETTGTVLVAVRRVDPHGITIESRLSDDIILRDTDSIFVILHPRTLSDLSHERLALGYALFTPNGIHTVGREVDSVINVPGPAEPPLTATNGIGGSVLGAPPASLCGHVVLILPSFTVSIVPFMSAFRRTSRDPVVVVCSEPVIGDESRRQWEVTCAELRALPLREHNDRRRSSGARGRRAHLRTLSGISHLLDPDEVAAWAGGGVAGRESDTDEVAPVENILDHGPMYCVWAPGGVAGPAGIGALMRARVAHAARCVVFAEETAPSEERADWAGSDSSSLAMVKAFEGEVERGHHVGPPLHHSLRMTSEAPSSDDADGAAVLVTRLLESMLSSKQELLYGLTTEVKRTVSVRLLGPPPLSKAPVADVEHSAPREHVPAAARRASLSRSRSRRGLAIIRQRSIDFDARGAPSLQPISLPVPRDDAQISTALSPRSAAALVAGEENDQDVLIESPDLDAAVRGFVPFRLDRRFISGRLAPVGIYSTLMIAAFLNPSLLRFITSLASGRETRLVHAAVPPETLHSAECMMQARHDGCRCTAAFGAVWLAMALRGKVVIGVFRDATSKSGLPWVETNPPIASRVRQQDVLFIVENVV